MRLEEGGHTLPGFVQEALIRIGTLFDTLFDTAQDAIFVMNGIRFVDCNPSTLQMFGCNSKEQIVGETPLRFSPARQPDGSASAEKTGRLMAAALDGVPQHFEWVHCRLDGSEFDVETRLNRFMVGGTPFVVAVVRDITARKRAEAELRRQMKADELINSVLARCAHCPPEQFDEQMVAALDELVRFIGADHAYFLVPSRDGVTYSCTHEVCGSGVAPQRSRYRDVPAGTNSWIESTLLAGKRLQIDSLIDQPDAERWTSEVDPGCRSLLLVPTRDTTGKFAGAIGVDSHARPLVWAAREVMLCTIIGNALTSLTRRKRARDRLLEEKLFSDRVIESLPGIFYLFDSDLRLRRWNKHHEAALGYTAEELRGRDLADWHSTDEERRESVTASRRALAGGDDIETIETHLVHKDGSAIPYMVSGARIDSASGPMLVGVGFNISARVEAERALAASERNYRELFDATNDALFIHDETGRILDVNTRACAMFGFECARAGQKTIGDLSLGEPPYTQREAIERLERALREGPQVFDWHSRRADGSLFWSEIALRAYETGGQRRFIASVRDVTERKLAGLERERLMAEAQAANSAKDQFLAVLSHELRTPLAAIQAGVGLMRHVASIDEPRLVRAVHVIERNVALQARLVDDLLHLSRLARGTFEIRRAPLQLDELVLSAVQACRADAARAGIALEDHVESGLWVDGDGDRLQQVVINLVGNAIKFTPRGGRVTISVSAKDRRGRVVVEDTGVGIEANRLSELFQMFRQGQIAARRAPGLGIGLALVRSIVELHGGRVWAESAGAGRGSRFTVELPLCEEKRDRDAREEAGSRGARIKMLLLEDNADTRTLLAETFEHLAYQVVSAESAEEALEILAREPVDVIVADIGLPGMDGYEFLRHARRLPSAARPPAFALTGYGQEKDVRLARDAGYAGHFVKPIDIDVIDQRIRSRMATIEDSAPPPTSSPPNS